MPYIVRVIPRGGGQPGHLPLEGYGEAEDRAKQAVNDGCDRVDIYQLVKDDAQIRTDIAAGGSGQSSP